MTIENLTGIPVRVADLRGDVTLTGLASGDILLRNGSGRWANTKDVSGLTVLPGGATVASTLAARLGVTHDAKHDHGAVGDGVADDTAAIEAACAAAKAAGGGLVFLPPGTYKIRRSIVLAANVTLKGAGRGVTIVTKAASVSSLLTVNCVAGATTATVTNGALFNVGDALHLYDTSNWEQASTQGRITGVAGNVLTFVNLNPGTVTGANSNYNTSRAAAATTSFPLIRNEFLAENIVVSDLTLDGNKGAGDPSGSQISFVLSPVHWEGAYRASVERCTIKNSCADSVSDQANSGRPGTDADGEFKATKNVVRDCRILDAVRHGVHLGTTMDGALVQNSEITGCGPALVNTGYGVFFCAWIKNVRILGNRIDGCGSGIAGIDDRDSDNVISGNTITGWLVAGIDAGNTASGGTTPGRLVIVGNKLNNTIAGTGGIFVNQPECTITGNEINIVGSYGLVLDSAAVRCTLTANVVTGTQAGGSTGMYIGASDARLIGNVVSKWATLIEVAGVSKLVATGQHLSNPTARAWWFTNTNTDCKICNEQNDWFTPVTLTSAPVRFVYEGLGDNGSTNPASGGAWNAASGTRWNGTLVRWNSGGGEKVSIFNDGVGWTLLN